MSSHSIPFVFREFCCTVHREQYVFLELRLVATKCSDVIHHDSFFAHTQGKTLAARAVANRTNATFIRIIGSELVQKYVGEGARMVREIFKMARTKSACIVFFDEIDAIGGTRVSSDEFSDNEVQRTMLQISSELDGFDARGNVKVRKDAAILFCHRAPSCCVGLLTFNVSPPSPPTGSYGNKPTGYFGPGSCTAWSY